VAVASSSRYRVGIDIGGTFTDLILVDDETGTLTIGKTLTTPTDPAAAVATVLREALDATGVDARTIHSVIHGTTLVTNAIIERKGALTALLTTSGFRDSYEIGREHRYDLYDVFLEMPQPLVPRHLRLEVDERTYADGSIGRELDRDHAARLIRELRAKGVRAIAVSLINSYANPHHERTLFHLLEAEAPELRVSLSSDVVSEIREYERTSTTVANVYVQELAEAYLEALQRRLAELGYRGELYIMLSSGGISTARTASRFPIRLIESGPAAGALAAAYYGQLAGVERLMAFDMGGTTAKLCVVEGGQPLVANEFEVDRRYRFKKGSGLPVKVPVIELIEIGAGGGSLARVDTLGLLKVGPDSAGADPGPVCYGRGGQAPTVTDADLLLGYLDPDFFLGGRMRLDRAAAAVAIEEQIAGPLGLTATDAAWGIHQIANERMANAARVHAIERGKDPRSFPLFAFGGAGPAHGFGVARILGAPALIAPFGAGVTSTVGFLSAPLSFDFVRSYFVRFDQIDWQHLGELFDEMERQGHELLAASGVPEADMRYERSADVRYAGQGHEVTIPVPSGTLDADSLPRLVTSFDAAYRALFGRAGPEVGLEAVSWRLVVRGPRPELRLRGSAIASTTGPTIKGERLAYFPEWHEHRPTPVYDRYALNPGTEFDGPAIVEERESTAIIGVGGHAVVDDVRNLRVTLSAVGA
jgi:N-methylhydantoinase A